jgi:hypothetical protein
MSASLPIQKSAAKLYRCRLKNQSQNHVAADSEIDNQTFKNRQPKTLLMPIQKSAAKNFATADSKIGSDGGVILTVLLFLFCVYISDVSWMKSGPIKFRSPTSSQHTRVRHFLSYKASYGAILMAA